MGIGDMIMFLPFIKAISNYYGEQVSLMVKKNTKASEATPGDIRVMPLYNGKTKEPKDTNYMFKIRIAYEFTKPEGSNIRSGPPAPNKVYIELGGKGSVVHDENWDKFVDKGLVK